MTIDAHFVNTRHIAFYLASSQQSGRPLHWSLHTRDIRPSMLASDIGKLAFSESASLQLAQHNAFFITSMPAATPQDYFYRHSPLSPLLSLSSPSRKPAPGQYRLLFCASARESISSMLAHTLQVFLRAASLFPAAMASSICREKHYFEQQKVHRRIAHARPCPFCFHFSAALSISSAKACSRSQHDF